MSDQTNKVTEIVNVNPQCGDLENWDDKAFPLMIESPDGTATGPFTTLTLGEAKLLKSLLVRPLNLATPAGVQMFSPVVKDNPNLHQLAKWLECAVASVEARKAKGTGEAS